MIAYHAFSDTCFLLHFWDRLALVSSGILESVESSNPRDRMSDSDEKVN
jgi:hypothetical protein